MTETITVDINPKYPITIGETQIVALVVKAQTFRAYGELVRKARKASIDFGTALFREWVLRNVEARDSSGVAVPFTLTDFLGWPAPYGLKLQQLQRASNDPAGTIVKDGNGTDEPCVYKLGKPLPGGKDGAKITELEFMVRTIGDIEAVMVNDGGKFDQVTALLATCATPIGGDVTLQRLPSFAMDALTLVDGLTVLEKVLPRFFESERP